MFVRIALFLSILVPVAGIDADSDSHFYDTAGNPLPEYESVYPELVKYYGTHVPPKITVRYMDLVSSKFNVNKSEVLINRTAKEKYARRTVAHESSHLCLASLTEGASVREEFRFFDEGFAKIFDSIVADDLGNYRTEALSIAGRQAALRNVSFEKVRIWHEYFGNPETKTNPYAYPVGSSFDFYIIDTFGEKKLFEFFTDIGKTRDLERTLKNVFSRGRGDFENGWLAYLAAKTPPVQTPKIVRIFPPDGAKEVDPKTEEIFVEFDQPMSRSVIITTPDCGGGVCYKNAYWKSRTVLAVKVALRENTGYRLTLGNRNKGHRLTSVSGVEFPITEWRFGTGLK
jgi:hypothetical protein